MAGPQASLLRTGARPVGLTAISPVLALMLVPVLAVALCAGPCGAVRLFSFGDSLLDVGNGDLLKTDKNDQPVANLPPYGMSLTPPRPTGRFSDGMVLADYLADYLGIPWPEAALSSSGNWTSGANFATGGAGILNTTNFTTLNVPGQIELFKEFIANQSLSASDLQDAIALISAGGNDFLSIIKRFPLTFWEVGKGPARAIQIANAVVSTIQALYATGLRNFLLMNIGAIGCVPAIRAVPFWGFGCQSDANSLAVQANALIDLKLAMLRLSLPDAAISVMDLYQGYYDVSKIMKANVPQGACCGAPGPINGQVSCGRKEKKMDATKACADPSKKVFWDNVHPGHTATGHLFQLSIAGSSRIIRPMNISAMVKARTTLVHQ